MSSTPQHQSRKAVAPDRTPFAQPDALKHLHVLLVEDEPDVASLFLFILQAGGASVQLAVSAQEGLEKLNFSCPDLLISNVKLPDQDGCWLLQQVRAQGFSQHQLPAIAVTSYTREVHRQEALAAGFQTFLSKPLDPDDLVQAVLQLVEAANSIRGQENRPTETLREDDI